MEKAFGRGEVPQQIVGGSKGKKSIKEGWGGKRNRFEPVVLDGLLGGQGLIDKRLGVLGKVIGGS